MVFGSSANLQALAEQKDGSLYNARVAAALLTLFAVLALRFRRFGLYGVLSHVVAERTGQPTHVPRRHRIPRSAFRVLGETQSDTRLAC
jgi:hypothetical protein